MCNPANNMEIKTTPNFLKVPAAARCIKPRKIISSIKPGKIINIKAGRMIAGRLNVRIKGAGLRMRYSMNPSPTPKRTTGI